MKKFTFLVASMAFTISAFAQTIPNPGFETWVNNTESQHTYSTPQGWVTTDILATYINEVFGNPGYVSTSTTQTNGSHTGSYAVQMAVVISNQGDTVPGGIYSDVAAADILAASFGAGNMGFGSTTRPASVNGFYKFTRVGGDSASVGVIMTRWNTSTQMRETVVDQEGYYITNNTTSYTAFSVPLTYLLNVNPDTVLIYAGNTSNLPHPGSIFTIDDLAFAGNVPIGINEAQANTVAAMLFPNPFTTEAELKVATDLDNADFVIYDLAGNKVREISGLNGSSVMINREGLSNGMYFYQLINKNAVIVTGKLSVE
jgi:hypothetical protein